METIVTVTYFSRYYSGEKLISNVVGEQRIPATGFDGYVRQMAKYGYKSAIAGEWESIRDRGHSRFEDGFFIAGVEPAVEAPERV
jgi:hypothetical protein